MWKRWRPDLNRVNGTRYGKDDGVAWVNGGAAGQQDYQSREANYVRVYACDMHAGFYGSSGDRLETILSDTAARVAGGVSVADTLMFKRGS